ncbi:stAR-related lipid transfer protein 9, partial [Silurus meridionalis]
LQLDGRLDGRAEAPGDSRERFLEFAFDYCYWSVNPEASNYASQEEVFQDLGMCVLTGASEGYNVCLFAYGQTGSGKTYTMMGNPDSFGLTPRICQGLFRSGTESPDGQNCRVEVSFLEIYNERVRDLLRRADQKKPATLRVREHPEKGPYVQGLTQHVVEDYRQAADLLEEGVANRITAATHVHDASSRSHAIFSIQYTQAILENNLPSEIVSKINLVDLAGSERADPNFCRDRITEGANINKSLVTLGIVISALAQNSQMCSSSQSINSMLSEGEASAVGSQSSSLSSSSRKHCFIPYRDSVLTWLLKDSLGGNSKTIMIATISPSCSSYNETLSTLRYAAHAKNIVNKPRVNEDASVRLIRELREEIDRLKSMLLSYSMQRNPSPSLSDERDSSLSDIVLQNELKVEQLTKDWSESWQDKRALLEQYNVDINQDRAGVQICSLQPHLISLEPDVLSTGVTIYHLWEGITRIGPQNRNEEEAHIVKPEGSVCEIENQNGVVTIKPLPHTTCTVNDREVTEPCRLAQGAVITLAGRHKFRFNHPAEAALLRERRRIIEAGPLFRLSDLNTLTPNARAEEVGGQIDSGSLAPWQKLEEHQRYVECLREEILVEQRRTEKDLEREQAHLRRQRSEIQQWILQEKQRLAAIREKGTLDTGVQTDVISLPALAGINDNESSSETARPSLIVGDRKRVVQEELLKHHALRRNENRIRRKRLRYQLERIARKRHLLEAKQELQRLETTLALGADGSLDLESSSKRRGRPMVMRRHSFSVDLLSRLYPQHTPIFSQFLRRNRLSESTSSLSRGNYPERWESDECLQSKPRGRSNTMPSRCSQRTSTRTGSSENMKIFMKENMPSEEVTERKAFATPLQSSAWNHNICEKVMTDADDRDSKKVLPIIKQSRSQKNSLKGGKSLPHEGNKGLETIRKSLSRSVGFGIKMALSKVFRKPPLGSRGGKSAKSASKVKTLFVVEDKKDKAVEDLGTNHPRSPIKSTVSCDGLDQLTSLNSKEQEHWHSAETLSKKTRRLIKTQHDLINWVENNGEEVTDDSSDCDSLFSMDSLSSAYAIALAEQLQQEDCEPSEVESVDNQMSKDSLVKESSGNTDAKPTLEPIHSICHTFHSLSKPESIVHRQNIDESKKMLEEFFGSVPCQKVARQAIKESSHLPQVTSDSRHSSAATVIEAEAFLVQTDAWSSMDAADSPRILGASETSLKRCLLSETSSSQSQASLDMSGSTTKSECCTSCHFDSVQSKNVTVKEKSHMDPETGTVLDYFLNDKDSITQKTISNNTLCSKKPTPPEIFPLKSNDSTLGVNAPFKESAVQSSLLPQNNFIESKQQTQSEESCNLETPSSNSNIFLQCDHQTHLQVQHSHSTLQPGAPLKSNNTQCSKSYDTGNKKDEPSEINFKSDIQVADSLRHCGAHLEHEFCNEHSRKRSKDSNDDLANILQTPKRSCVDSLVQGDSAVSNVPFLFNDSSNSSRDLTGQLLPTEKERCASLPRTIQHDLKTASMDNHTDLHQDSNNQIACCTLEDRFANTASKDHRISIIRMNKSVMQGLPDVKCPDIQVEDKGVFKSNTLHNPGLTINDEISEVVKEHLNTSLQVDGGENINEEPETNKTSTPTNSDALKNTQRKNEMIAEFAQVKLCSSHTSQCEYSVDDRVNIDNTGDCVKSKYLERPPTENEVKLDQQEFGFLSNSPFELVKSFSVGRENSDNHNGPVPPDLKKVPEENNVLFAVPTNNHPELSTSHSNGFIDGESGKSKETIQLTLMSTCKQSPDVILPVTVAEAQNQFFQMKSETITITKSVDNTTQANTSVITDQNGFNLLSHTQKKLGISPEENSMSGVSKDACNVTVSKRCSVAVVNHIGSDMLIKEMVKSVETSNANMAAKFQQVVELNTVSHFDTESTVQIRKNKECSFNSDRAENVQDTDSSRIKMLAYQECAGEKHGFIIQEHLNSENDTKEKNMDLESHNCLLLKGSKPCQTVAFCTSELGKDSQTQIIQSVIISEKPPNFPQNEDQSLYTEDHTLHRTIQEQRVNVQHEKKHSDQQHFQDLSILSKSVQRPEQIDTRKANNPDLTFSASKSLNPKEPLQVEIESTEKANGEKQHTTINGSRLVFSRTNEERQRGKLKRYRKAHFTAPLSSSTDSTPDSSLDEKAKSRVHKSTIATSSGTPAPGRLKTENRKNSADESNTSLSLEIISVSVESKSKQNQSYRTGSDNPNPYIRDLTTDKVEKLRDEKYNLPAKLFQIPSLQKNCESSHQLTGANSTKHILNENNHEKAKSFEKDSIPNREPFLHFSSSDINPFVHTRKKDRLLKTAYKNQPFGSAVNINSRLSSLKSSNSGITRCCSMDNGLNVQNSPFSSHLSTYAVQKGLSSTLSSTEDSKEHISTEPKLKESFHTPTICKEKILTASGSDSCNDTLELASGSGQVDEIVLVYSSDHEESQDSNQESRKYDQGTQTVKCYEDLEKKTKHRRSSTQVPVSKPSTTWTSLQNMSEHLSELIVSTSDLLGNIQCMRTGESSLKNGTPLTTFNKVSKIRSNKSCKTVYSTQTGTDVGIQTEDVACMKQNFLQSSQPIEKPKSHEVSVIVKVIGSELCSIPKQDGAIKPIKEPCESRQTFGTVKSMPDLHPTGSPFFVQFGGNSETENNPSLETVAPNQCCFNPIKGDHKTSKSFAVCAQRKCHSQTSARDNQKHQQIKPKNNLDERVLLIDRASSPILTVDVSRLTKRRIKSGTIQTPTEALSQLVRNTAESKPVYTSNPQSHYQTENKSGISVSLENLSIHSCTNLGAPDACSTEVSSSRYIQNERKKHPNGVQSRVSSQAIWCSPWNYNNDSSSVKNGQPADLNQNRLQSSTPINQSHIASRQNYKHRIYKDVSCCRDPIKDTLQYQDEDSVSLVPSDCNTDILLSINPLSETSPLQEDFWIPENLPMHNKFNNWSGISQQPPARLTNENNTAVAKSPDIKTHNPHLCSVESKSFRYRHKTEVLESADTRSKEIEKLRKEREQVLASTQLDLSPHLLSVELKEAKLHYGLEKTDTLLKMLKSSSRADSTVSTKQQLYDRHRRSIDGLRKEREDRLQTSRRARSLSPSKHPNPPDHTTEQSRKTVDSPSRQREYLQHLRKEVVEMSRVPDPPRRDGQYPTDIELLLRDYGRAREEAMTEIARARVRLRERMEQEKRRLEQQALAQCVKDHLRLCTRVSNSTLCTGSNLSLSSGPTSGYNSSNAALLKDGISPSIQINGVSERDSKGMSRTPMISPQTLKAPRAWLSAQDICMESSSYSPRYKLHSSSSPSSPPGRQRTCSFSSPSSISVSYQNTADCTLTSAISEVHLASGGNLRNLLAGSADAGWRHQGLENGVQTFHRPSSRPSAHGFLGAMELERPKASLWSLIRDHSKIHLYNKSLKSAWTHVLNDTTQLVYLLTDPSNCHMKQPRDFCCLSTESKREDTWVLAMQSVFEESLPRPSADTVRGEMFPSAWILQRSQLQGRETVIVIYLLQVDLGTPTLPQRLLNVVARKQAAVISDLDSFLS